MVKKIRKAVFPVAGLGTRFLPATKAMPKEMLPLVDKPLIQYAVEEAIAAGIEEIIFVTGRGKSALEDHFDRSVELENILAQKGKVGMLESLTNILPDNVRVTYTRQGEPLGLGHAIYCAKSIVGDEPFAVLLADDVFLGSTPCLKQMVNAYAKEGGHLLAVMDVDPLEVHKYGIIDPESNGQKIIKAKGLVEKPSADEAPSNLAICGRYILQPEIFDILATQQSGTGGEIQLTDAINQGLPEQKVSGFRFEGERFDCGSNIGWLQANIRFAMDRDELKEPLREFLSNISSSET